MNQVIILEGPDGAGKTTLAAKLAEMLRGEVWHEGPPNKGVDLLEHYAQKLLKALKADRPVICDRLFLGEHVYGPTARDADQLGKRGVRMLRRLVNAYGAVEVLCLPPWSEVLSNYGPKLSQKDDYLQSYALLWEVFKRYEATLIPSGDRLVWDYTDTGLPAWHHSCSLADMTYVRSRQDLLPLSVIGSPKAKVLLVGERSNGNLDLPFFSLTGSSRYLDDALQLAKVPERDLALVNAYPPGGPGSALEEPRVKTLKQVVSRLKDPLVVSLGHAATKACTQAGVKVHVQLAHPSAHKRFSFKLRDEYTEQLKSIYLQALKGDHRADTRTRF